MGVSALVAGVLAVMGPFQVAPISGGNAFTLPSNRHLVRVEPAGRTATWLVGIQQEGADGRGLGWFRSDDEAQTWRYYAPIQNDTSHIDHLDLVKVGLDLAITYAWEGPQTFGD